MARPRILRILWLVGAWAAAGCTGDIDLRGYQGPRDQVSSGITRRMSRYEYEASLRTLFGDAAIDAIPTALGGLPDDRFKAEFTTQDRGITARHVDAYFDVADQLSAYLVASPGRLEALQPGLSAANVADATIQSFLTAFGRRAFRRPLLDAERADLLATYADGKAITQADGIQNLLVAMLLAPPFLYRVEQGDPVEDKPGTYRLNAYELATRVSFLAWGTTPDDLLLDAAASGALETPEGLDAQLDRLFADPRAKSAWLRFLTEWLDASFLPAISQSDTFLAGLNRSVLLQAMEAELRAYLDLHVSGNGNYTELLTSDVSYVTSPVLAQLYGVTPAPDGRVTFDSSRRGLLTRAALLLSPGEQTHPILRGVFVSRKLLCDPIKPPDPSQFPPGTIGPPAFDPAKTGRTRWAEKTSQPACNSCHGRINPYGFALEHFDSLGRFRTQEPIVDPANGQVVNTLPIDTQVSLEINWAEGGAPLPAHDSTDMGRLLGESAVANRCFAQQWFRYVHGRKETEEDAPVIDDMLEAGTGDSGSILSMFKSIARAPEFRMRRVAP